jgi:signal peptidase I
MWPTLMDGQLACINKLAYFFRPPARGELVAVWTGKEFLVKRVIALPGEEVGMVRGVFYINGVPLPEPYVQQRENAKDLAPGRIEGNCFVVASDNRPVGVCAVVSRQRIVGRVVTFLRQAPERKRGFQNPTLQPAKRAPPGRGVRASQPLSFSPRHASNLGSRNAEPERPTPPHKPASAGKNSKAFLIAFVRKRRTIKVDGKPAARVTGLKGSKI